jgi:hypothetical protein
MLFSLRRLLSPCSERASKGRAVGPPAGLGMSCYHCPAVAEAHLCWQLAIHARLNRPNVDALSLCMLSIAVQTSWSIDQLGHWLSNHRESRANSHAACAFRSWSHHGIVQSSHRSGPGSSAHRRSRQCSGREVSERADFLSGAQH